MRRWNGWGDEKTTYHLPQSAIYYLEELIGEGAVEQDAHFDDIASIVPDTKLPEHPLINFDSGQRVLHARGQSFPDWLALRTGLLNTFPDGVAFPTENAEIQTLIKLAQEYEFNLIPYGGGTSVVGHINPPPGQKPTLTMDMSKLSDLISLDETSRLATFGAGIWGPQIEELLGKKGFTLGHYPQSFELSTLGGWIATRSSGQQSYYYGRIEDLFAGGHIETPVGSLDLPLQPASAAGPDIKQIILGSEGRLGVITQATVRISPIPEREAFFGVFFREWDAGVQTVREIAQARLPVSMARLSDVQETETNLRLSGKDELVNLAKRGLNLLNYRDGRCLLIMGVTGNSTVTRFAKNQALRIIRKYDGLFTGTTIGNIWKKSRFLTPYLRNTLWDHGYGVDTLETALPWSLVNSTTQKTIQAIHQEISNAGSRALIFSHLSHIYRDGASFYITYIFPLCQDPNETYAQWGAMKAAASQVITDNGGTISHQHGVGTDHAAYLEIEKGGLGMQLIENTAATLDPQGIMNPGKLIINSSRNH